MSLEEQLEEGGRQWTIAWRRFTRQRTQPQLLKLADSIVGDRHLHRSQISGFATGKLREPSPKVFLVIGRLNEAVASKSTTDSDIMRLLENKEAIRDKTGTALDANDCFRVFTGQLDLGYRKSRKIEPEEVEHLSVHMGAQARKAFSEAGIDFIAEMQSLTKQSNPAVEKLLLHKPMTAEELSEAAEGAERLLKAMNTKFSIDELWNAS